MSSPGRTPQIERRRAATQRVREARDRLTSSTGTRPAFDYELLRQFAHNRLSASLAILLLVGTIGFLSGLSTGAALNAKDHGERRDFQVFVLLTALFLSLGVGLSFF